MTETKGMNKRISWMTDAHLRPLCDVKTRVHPNTNIFSICKAYELLSVSAYNTCHSWGFGCRRALVEGMCQMCHALGCSWEANFLIT